MQYLRLLIGRHSLWLGLIAFGFTTLLLLGCQSQTDRSIDDALEVITPSLIGSHIGFLSHDLLRGRDTGDVGYAIGAEYVASQFSRIGRWTAPRIYNLSISWWETRTWEASFG
jgi:hypothetical protein